MLIKRVNRKYMPYPLHDCMIAEELGNSSGVFQQCSFELIMIAIFNIILQVNSPFVIISLMGFFEGILLTKSYFLLLESLN